MIGFAAPFFRLFFAAAAGGRGGDLCMDGMDGWIRKMEWMDRWNACRTFGVEEVAIQ